MTDLNLGAIEACASRDREGASPEDTIALVARVRELEAALQRERERADKAEAACVAMREVLSRVVEYIALPNQAAFLLASAEAALASDAG